MQKSTKFPPYKMPSQKYWFILTFQLDILSLKYLECAHSIGISFIHHLVFMDLWLTGTPTNGFQTQYSPSLSYFNAIRHHLVFTGLKSPSFFSLKIFLVHRQTEKRKFWKERTLRSKIQRGYYKQLRVLKKKKKRKKKKKHLKEDKKLPRQDSFHFYCFK